MEKRILVADDEEVLRELIPRFLERICSIKVDLAKNAAEAIARVRETKYDLVISDNNMHDELRDEKGVLNENSGIYAIGEIRKFNSTVPIILLSGGLSIKAKAAAEAAGATEIVEKPEYGELVQKATKYLVREAMQNG